jgi:FtsH-binding integral membrane protein
MAEHDHTISGDYSLGQAPAETRAHFLVRTYHHLFGAILFFAALEVAYFQTGFAERAARVMFSVNWLLILGAFMIVAWFARRFAYSSASLASQYFGLAFYVVAQSILFIPLLYQAERFAPGAISSAAVVSLLGFAGLTWVAYSTRKDFSFLGGILRWGFIVALVAIVGAVVFGFHLGTWFSVAMVALAGAAILHDTSRVLRDFPKSRYVGAALELFASAALLFWYVLRIFTGARD